MTAAILYSILLAINSYFLQQKPVSVKTDITTDNTNWINSFKAFRTAVYSGDKQKVKSFFSFPISSEDNSIWYLVYGGGKKSETISTDKPTPFTEKDFDTYYKKLFPKEFVKSIIKIKTPELAKKKETESIRFKEDNLTYYMIASMEDKKTLVLNLAHTYSEKIKGSNEYEVSEYNFIYYFTILPNQTLQFKKVMMAG